MVERRILQEVVEMTIFHNERAMPHKTVKEVKDAIVRVIQIANEPARRFRILWYVVAWSCALVYFVIGVGYAGAGHGAIQSNALSVVSRIEGNLRIHGSIMMAIAIFLTYGLNDYRRVTRIALVLYFFYSIWTAIMIFSGWFIHGLSWGAPWWYVFTSTLSGALLVLAPPLSKNGKRFSGHADGSESA